MILKDYYLTEVKNQFRASERKWKRSKQSLFIGIGLILVSILSFWGLIGMSKIVGVFLLGGAVYLIWAVYFSYSWDALKKDFREKVIRKIVNQVNPEWEYYPNQKVGRSLYLQSGLIDEEDDVYKGNSLIRGKIGQTLFESSAIHTIRRRVNFNDSGKLKGEWHTIFQGLFFHADFNKHFKGQTYVLPDFAEKNLGHWGRFLQAGTSKGQLIRLENIDFEREFVVYSTNQVEARYIITPVIMKAMLEIRQYFKVPVYFSFVGNSVFCAANFDANVYGLPFIETELYFNKFKHIHQIVKGNMKLIEALQLNTRIWTKE